MAAPSPPELLQIKKYPNRRYYDTTRSCHVTLQGVYDLVRDGHDVCITDSRTNEDITNLVLIQVLLDKDQPKLDLFPSSALHLMIRSNREVVGSSVQRFFGPFQDMLAVSQKQFDHYLRQVMRGSFASPLDWASRMVQAFSPVETSSSSPKREAEPNPTHVSAPPTAGDVASAPSAENMADLKRQLAMLTARIEELTRGAEKKA